MCDMLTLADHADPGRSCHKCSAVSVGRCFSRLSDMFLLLLQCETALVQLYLAKSAVLMQSVSFGFYEWP